MMRPPARSMRRLHALEAADSLSPAAVGFADLLRRRAGEANADVLLAAALAIEATFEGSSCARLELFEPPASVDGAPVIEPPVLAAWLDRLRASGCVGQAAADGRPLVLRGSHLYPARYDDMERRVVARLGAMTRSRSDVDPERLASAITAMRAEEPAGDGTVDIIADVCAAAATRGLILLTGGPGTGKTYTVARLLRVLGDAGVVTDPADVRVLAPTGKAAARLKEAASGAHEGTLVAALGRAQTIHRALGAGRGGPAGFARHATDPLLARLVIVDEVSMVDLALMDALLDALPVDARLILVGDPDQLPSVDVGSVLRDVRDAAEASADPDWAACNHRLKTTHRFAANIRGLAERVLAGDEDAVVEYLRSGVDGVEWVPVDADADRVPASVVSAVAEAARAFVDPARAGDGDAAVRHLEDARVLCATRRGPFGVSGLGERIASRIGVEGPLAAGAPVLITRNARHLDLSNGDVGVAVAGGTDGAGSAARVVFSDPSAGSRALAAALLPPHEPCWAMTIHKSQGSQFGHVTVVFPPEEEHALASRELLYTAITRARDGVRIVTSEVALRAAVRTAARRASGVGERLADRD